MHHTARSPLARRGRGAPPRSVGPAALARAVGPAALLVGLLGCEPVEPMAHPFQPVPVAAPAAVGAADAAPAADPRFAELDETFVISSEELRELAPEQPDAEPQPPAEPAAAPVADPPPAAAPAPTPLPLVATAPMVAQVPAAPLGWAIRLVSTLPEAQPPRAILGLPDGQEIVVTPGSMVPQAGLVVLAIGTQGVQLARVQAQGDHAAVDAISLTPQY